MQEITVTINQQTMDWLIKRSITENCTVEDFASVILTAVCINSQINQIKNEKEKIHEEAH